MILYHRGGALDFELLGPTYDKRELEILKYTAIRDFIADVNRFNRNW